MNPKKENDMKPMISVIVPAYNNKNYIDYCINSLRKQTYTNIEVLIIDDGSDEKIGRMYDQYAKWGGIRVIHKPNGGVSSARNMGLLEAKGEYICFVDSDDYVASEFVEKLYNAIQKYKVDISACAYRRVTDDNYSLLVQNKANEIEEYYISADDKWSNVLRNSHSAEGFLWNKMFAKNCLANLQFDENIKMSEDMLFVFHALERVNDIVVVDTWIRKITPVTVVFEQTIKNKDSGKLFIQAEFEVVAIRNNGSLHRRMPEVLKNAFEKVLSSCPV